MMNSGPYTTGGVWIVMNPLTRSLLLPRESFSRRNTGANLLFFSSMDSPIGKICLAASQRGIKRIELATSEKDFLNSFPFHIKIVRADKVFDRVKSLIISIGSGFPLMRL